MLSYREPVYQGITEELGNENHKVDYLVPRRRPVTKNLKDRLTNIVSMYVPNNSNNSGLLSNNITKNEKIRNDLVDQTDLNSVNDHFGLLNLNDLERSSYDSLTNDENSTYKIVRLIDSITLFDLISGSLQDTNYSILAADRKITCIASDNSFIYIGIQNAPYIFKINLKSLPVNPQSSPSKLKQKNSYAEIQCIHLCLPGSGVLIPNNITLKYNDGKACEIYVIGEIGNLPLLDDFRHVLTCFTLEGKLIAKTRKYSYKRYLSIDIDIDGNPLLACSAAPDDVGNSNVAQICKLTPYFERRIFSVYMNNGKASYLPEWISKTSAGNMCWASVCRYETDDNGGRSLSRRIFAFHGVQPVELNGCVKSPKEWLHVISWNFGEFSAGSVVAIDNTRLLALDTEKCSLAIITWPPSQATAILQKITKPGSQLIDFLSSPYVTYSNDKHSTVAYLISKGDIFKFLLPETKE